MKPSVSVIVPIYNVEKYFDRCMNSLLNQTLTNIEIILVDDGSPDGCPEKCDYYKQLDTRVRVIHKKNGGLGYARNSGLEIAQGEFVAYLDSDDYVEVTMYEILYNYAKKYNLDTVISGFNYQKNNGTIIRHAEVPVTIFFRDKKEVHGLLLDMLGAVPGSNVDYKYEMSVWRGIYSKNIIDQFNIRFPSEREYISEDIIYHFDYFEHSENAAIVPETLYFYCDNNASLTKSYREDRYIKTKILFKKILEMLERYDYPAESKLYAQRMFLARVRVAAVQIVKSESIKSKGVAKNRINQIADDALLQEIIGRYPVAKLPIQQKIFIHLLMEKRPGLIKLVVHLNDWRKK